MAKNGQGDKASMDTEVMTKLGDDQLLDRGMALARRVAEVERLRKKKADDAKSTQALIDTALDECARLSRVMNAQEELRRQGDLFVDPTVAANVLAEVHERSVADQVDTLIEEQAAQMDANTVPTVEAIPDACPKCEGTALREVFGDSVMCEADACTWVAKLAGKVAPELVPVEPAEDEAVVEERRCEAMQWISTNGGSETVIEAAAMWWEKFQPRAEFGAAMVSWRSNSGAPVMVPELLKESIELKRDNIGFEQKPAEPCAHTAVQGKPKPKRGKHLVCPDCNVVLHDCQGCGSYQTPDDLGPCEWDECGGTKLCLKCLREHEAKAAQEAAAAGDIDDPNLKGELTAEEPESFDDEGDEAHA